MDRVLAVLESPTFTLRSGPISRGMALSLDLHLLDNMVLTYRVEAAPWSMYDKARPLNAAGGTARTALPKIEESYGVSQSYLASPDRTPSWPVERFTRWLDLLGIDTLTASLLSYDFEIGTSSHRAEVMKLARAWHPDPVDWPRRVEALAARNNWEYESYFVEGAGQYRR